LAEIRFLVFINRWKGAGAVELAALEMLCASKGHRGFESHPFRHLDLGFGIADLGFKICFNPKSQIRNPKSKLWLQAPHKV
jgi:hypothetical protein